MSAAERLAGLEVFRQILTLLTPEQLVVVALRLEGLNAAEVAEELGLHRRSVNARLERAQARVLAAMPELAVEVEGRSLRNGISRRREAEDG